jgi:hypothetical protein
MPRGKSSFGTMEGFSVEKRDDIPKNSKKIEPIIETSIKISELDPIRPINEKGDNLNSFIMKKIEVDLGNLSYHDEINLKEGPITKAFASTKSTNPAKDMIRRQKEMVAKVGRPKPKSSGGIKPPSVKSNLNTLKKPVMPTGAPKKIPKIGLKWMDDEQISKAFALKERILSGKFKKRDGIVRDSINKARREEK